MFPILKPIKARCIALTRLPEIRPMTLVLTTSLIGQQSCENYFKIAALEARVNNPSVTPGGH